MPRTSSTKTLSPPRIGAYWPGQGGVLVALMRGEPGEPDYYLIAAHDKGRLPAPCAYATDKVAAADADSFRDGERNTASLLARKGMHPAAIAASAYTADGHSDFYLPARAEARAIHINTPELLPEKWIWTSTQNGAHYAWYQGSNGNQGRDGKDNQGAVVPVRRLLAIE